MKDVQTYLGHLWELDKRYLKDLSEDQQQDLAQLLIRELPYNKIPSPLEIDVRNEIMVMFNEWMTSEDDYLGYNVLSKMRDLTVKVMKPYMEDVIDEYRSNQERAVRQTEISDRQHIEADNRQRC